MKYSRFSCVPQELNANELGNLVWSIARASHASPRTTALLAVVTARAAQIIDGFPPSQLARLLHSLAQLSFYHHDLLARAEDYVRLRVEEFTADDLALTATAFVRFIASSVRHRTGLSLRPVFRCARALPGRLLQNSMT